MISGVSGDELRARQRRALNELTLDERLGRTPEADADFDCECGRLRCGERIRLTPREFAAFRRNFSGFVVAPGHENKGSAASDRVDEMSANSFPASDPPAAWTWEPKRREPAPVR